jgi:hypothetical protein
MLLTGLCQVCRSLLPRIIVEYASQYSPKVPHTTNIGLLRDSTRDCMVCTVFGAMFQNGLAECLPSLEAPIDFYFEVKRKSRNQHGWADLDFF